MSEISRFSDRQEDPACVLCRNQRYHGPEGRGNHFIGTSAEYEALTDDERFALLMKDVA